MPRANQDNVKLWLEKTEIDFFTHFVKAWIPFNAWYRLNYDTLENEREILNEVKRDGNRIRSRIIARIEGPDPDSEEIRNYIAALHRRLAADPLEGRHGKVSFEHVLIGPNLQRHAEIKYGHWTYRVERILHSKNVIATITSSYGRVVCTINQTNGWNIEEFETDPNFLTTDVNDKPRLLQCYTAAHPSCFVSLLASSPPPSDALVNRNI